MNTASSALTAQPISRSTLLELLSSEGIATENLGAGLRESLDCLRHARDFYDLPVELEEPLQQFSNKVWEALIALEEARELI